VNNDALTSPKQKYTLAAGSILTKTNVADESNMMSQFIVRMLRIARREMYVDADR